MRSQMQPALPSGRAFVVQFHAEANIAKGLFTGRVEHIVSYQATHFDSLEALVTFIERVLAAHEAEEEDESGDTLGYCNGHQVGNGFRHETPEKHGMTDSQTGKGTPLLYP
jgi:hypothetical protein